MSSLPGLFDSFDNLDLIEINSLLSWFKKSPPKPQFLENYLANKILYPKTLPQTESDIKIDLVILREALRINAPKHDKTGELLGQNPFLNITLRKVIIPERFLQYIPDLVSLTWAFVDGLLLNRAKKDFFEDLWTIVVAGQSDEVVGSLLLPQFGDLGQSLELSVMGKNYKIKAGSLTHVPCLKFRCEIAYKSSQTKILGQTSNSVEVYGGRLGLMVDGRVR